MDKPILEPVVRQPILAAPPQLANGQSGGRRGVVGRVKCGGGYRIVRKAPKT